VNDLGGIFRLTHGHGDEGGGDDEDARHVGCRRLLAALLSLVDDGVSIARSSRGRRRRFVPPRALENEKGRRRFGILPLLLLLRGAGAKLR